ncbi:type I secretion system permease/ATPase [Alloyangia pacifica]|uniref:type I secretion system permease/ATPase n=2 Tax=Roseobacteraceae TaxID=2854170 RepID=UPI0031D1497D
MSEPAETSRASGPRLRIAPRVAHSEPTGNVLPEWQFPRPESDPLAACLLEAMRHLGRDPSLETLRSGLPLPPDGALTPELALRAADTQGFDAMMVRRRQLDSLPNEVLPAVLFLASREACLLLGRQDDGCALVFWPSRGEERQSIALAELQEAYVGHALLLRQRSETSHTSEGAEPARHWFWGAARANWPDYLQVVLASGAVNLLALAVPLFTMNVYDRVFPNAALTTLWSLVAGVAIALLLDAGLKWLRAGIVDAAGRRLDLTVSAALFRHISGLRLEAMDRSSGALMNALKDFEQVRDFFGSQTVASLTDLAFSLLFLVVIFYIGGPLVLPPAIALAATLLIGLAILIPLRRAASRARHSSGVKNAVAVEAITALETLKATSGHGRMQGRWERQVLESATAQEGSRTLATFATTSTAFIQQCSSIGIVIIGVYMALEGHITMGAVIAAVILSGRALAPSGALSSLFLRGSYAMATLRSLDTLMRLESDASPRLSAVNASNLQGALTLDAACLRYPAASMDALDTITLEIPDGAHIGVLGPVGAGKSSLVRLMSGLYRPTGGLVCLGGINLQQIDSAQLRSIIQLVPQDAVLFSGTLAENIAFGVPGARDRDILRAAREAGADRIAAQHPDGFAMRISERGSNLSGGQRQLVALARALLMRPKILVLDEPTSAMDQASEQLFVERLRTVLDQRPMTLIVSTHRMGLLALTDRLIVLDQGKLVQDGPKNEVLDRLAGGARS